MNKGLWMVFCLATFITACKKKASGGGSSLPTNSDVMEVQNGWEVVGQHEIPIEWQVDNVVMPFLQDHGSYADVMFMTEKDLQFYIQRQPYRWRLRLNGENISTNSFPYTIWEGEGKTGDDNQVIWHKYLMHSSGMGDQDLRIMNSSGIYRADSSGTREESFSWKGDWVSDIFEYTGPFGSLAPNSFMITPTPTFGGPVLAKMAGKKNYVFYSTDLRPAGGGINSKGEMVTLNFNWRHPRYAYVYASTQSLAAQTLNSKNELCYMPVVKNIYPIKDLSKDSVPDGADKVWMWHQHPYAWLLVKSGNLGTMYRLNVEEYTVEVIKAGAITPEHDATLVPDKPGQFFDLYNRNVGRMCNGNTWTNVQRPKLKSGVGAYMWDMCYSGGRAWLLCEYKKTMVLLRSKPL